MSVLVACHAHSQCSAAVEAASGEREREPIVGLPCEGCEAVFSGLPQELTWTSRIAAVGEAGEPMRIEGRVRDGEGRAASAVIVCAYHTDARGLHPTDDRLKGQASHRHGTLRAWAKTDESGRYRFDTIRPAGYPWTDLPAHVHLHVIEVGSCTYSIDDILFENDPRLTEASRAALTLGRGGSGIAAPTRDASGVWLVTRDIVLCERIPGHLGSS